MISAREVLLPFPSVWIESPEQEVELEPLSPSFEDGALRVKRFIVNPALASDLQIYATLANHQRTSDWCSAALFTQLQLDEVWQPGLRLSMRFRTTRFDGLKLDCGLIVERRFQA